MFYLLCPKRQCHIGFKYTQDYYNKAWKRFVYFYLCIYLFIFLKKKQDEDKSNLNIGKFHETQI